MKIFVSGGAGFIGSHVTELFCNEGHEVIVFDNLSFGYREFVDKRAKFINGSLADKALLEKNLAGVDAVIHLAASSIISRSFRNPIEYIQNNVLYAANLLEAMRKNGVKKIINSSSASVYGEPVRVPIKESDLKRPVTIYGSTKLAFEEILGSYYYSFGIESVSLRYFNAYGPRDAQQPATRAVPIWFKAILQNQGIPLYWEGKQLRDYVYAGDIAQAHLDVLNLKGLHIYNIGSGKGILMKDLLKQIENAAGKKANVVQKGKREGDPMKLLADTSLIKKEVGWVPKVRLEDGLQKTYEYYKLNRKNFKN